MTRAKHSSYHHAEGQGKYLTLCDNINYNNEAAPEAADSFNQESLAEAIHEWQLDEELIATIENWVEEQVKLGTREFIKRLTIRMSQTLHGFCVLRALGYHAQLEQNGKPIKSLRQIAKYFSCSHQYVDKLTKDLQHQLGVDPAHSSEIETKTYSMEITAPQGYLTYGQAIKQHNITRRELKQIIDSYDIQTQPYKRNSKIVDADQLNTAVKNAKESI